MAQIDTRHAERERYFDLLMIKAGGDVDLMIDRLAASMEEEDIRQVEERVALHLERKAES
jgi:hypothetical protein